MQEAENLSSQDELAGEVMESLGVSDTAGDSSNENSDSGSDESELPGYAKEKIGKLQKRQERDRKRHERELQLLQAQIHEMRQGQSMHPQMGPTEPPINYSAGNGVMNDDERIQKAVIAALSHKDMQERQAKNQEKVAHVHRQYQALQDHLDNAGSKYDDFDEVVRADDAPFTNEIRDASLLIPNAADVLYKLGKNKDELKRISSLHPLEQAKEVVKLSFALMNGGTEAKQQTPKTIGQIKSSPVTSKGVNDSTSVGDLRRLMKRGWK